MLAPSLWSRRLRNRACTSAVIIAVFSVVACSVIASVVLHLDAARRRHLYRDGAVSGLLAHCQHHARKGDPSYHQACDFGADRGAGDGRLLPCCGPSTAARTSLTSGPSVCRIAPTV